MHLASNGLNGGARAPATDSGSGRCWQAVALVITLLLSAPNAVAEDGWIPMEVHEGDVRIRTRISGIDGWSVFDTGAQVNAINGRFVAANNLSWKQGAAMKIQGVAATEQRRTFRKVPVELMGTTVEFKDLVEVTYGSPEYQLLIGAGFLQRFIVQFDYPNQRMRLLQRKAVNLRKVKNVRSRSDPDGGSLLVKVRINDESDHWLLMDTGYYGGVLIARDEAIRLDWLKRYPSRQASISGVNATRTIDKLNLPKLEFGGFEIENPIVELPAEGESFDTFKKTKTTGSRINRRRQNHDGFLGYDVLKHFVVTVDYRAGHVHVAPP